MQVPKTDRKDVSSFDREVSREIENLKSLVAELAAEVNKLKGNLSRLKAGG